jgi:hypothetical protein
MTNSEIAIPQDELARLISVDPRAVWPSEAANFTPWLRENIDRLADVLGIGFDEVTSEEPVGRFSADLWGQEEGTAGRSVVIENQLTESDHDHLGKLLTYAGWLKADIAVWVATQFREEHLEALRSLNNSSGGQRHYFAIQIDVFQIGGPPRAPFFRVLVQPQGWATGPRDPRTKPSPRMRAYHDFFDELLSRLKTEDPGVTDMSRVGYQSWLPIPSGRTGFSFNWSFARGQRFRVELYIDPGDRERNKQVFDALESQREEIEDRLREHLSWERLEDARASRIALYRPGSIDYSEEKLEELARWATDKLLAFRAVFGERIKEI